MSSLRLVPLASVWAALDACLPGWTVTKKVHHWCVRSPNGENVYPRLPLGEHGRRRDEEVEAGHVRKMARTLGILDCMCTAIPGLC